MTKPAKNVYKPVKAWALATKTGVLLPHYCSTTRKGALHELAPFDWKDETTGCPHNIIGPIRVRILPETDFQELLRKAAEAANRKVAE